MDEYMMAQLGVWRFNDIHNHELLAVAYAYNQQQPRFFSKYFNYKMKSNYDVVIGKATGASAAAPTFFDPQVIENGYGINELLIDGGVIANNPGWYAYQMADKFYKKDNIRMISLGTGEKPFEQYEASTFTKTKMLGALDELMMNIETYTSDKSVEIHIKDPKQNYVRVNIPSTLPMDQIGETNVNNLLKAGEDMYEKAVKAGIKTLLEKMMEDRYA